MSKFILTPEKYINFKNSDIASMCVDVALTIVGKDNIGFNENRVLSNSVSNNPQYAFRLQKIASDINNLGIEISSDKDIIN